MKSKLQILAGGIFLLCTSLFFFSCNKDEDNVEREKYAWVAGNADSTGYGMIMFSADSGYNWQRQGQGNALLSGVDFMDVWAVDENKVWVVGSGNKILKTTNGGLTWARVEVPGGDPGADLASISLAGSQNIWISGSLGKIYHSTDDGSTWQVFTLDYFTGGLMQGIHAVSSQVVYVAGGVGNSGIIARTLNGGQTWDTISPPDQYNSHGNWIGVKATDANHVVVYGGQSRYTVTSDGGQSWNNDSIAGTGGINGADINCLTMLDDHTWWGAFDFDGIYLTENSGDNWIRQPSADPGGMFLVGIDHFDRQHAIITGISIVSINGKILVTSDGGITWELALSTHAWINKVSFIKK